MFIKSEVYCNPSNWQPIFCPVYELSRPLAADQPFDKWKEKITPGIYLGMYPINARPVALVRSLSLGRVSPQFHVEFYPYFATINGCNGNLVPLSYCQAMCGFVKGKKSVFVNSEKHDPSTTFIYPPDQGCTISENIPEQE